MQKPKKWYDVYPYGTKEGDEEAKVFRALSRHPKFDYRSTGAVIKATGIPRERIEEIIDKYISCDPPLIFPHPTNEEHWGYWERCPDRVADDGRNLSDKDQDGRIDKHLAGASMIDNSSAGKADAVLCGSVADIKSLADLSNNKEWTLDV
jgi:hypothetical protein